MTNIAERDSKVIWHPFTQMQDAALPIAIVRGEGAMLFGENKKKYIDGISSWWVNLHGHAHPYIAEKIAKQLLTLEHVIFAGFTHAPAVELAERLLKILPQNQSRIFYSDNGSTAVEVALKMAIQYWHNLEKPKYRVVALKNAYHGDTFGAMSVGARASFNIPFEPLLFETEYIDAPYDGHWPDTLAQMEEIFMNGDTAAFIFEPLVQGSAGMKMYPAEALDRMLALCRKYNIITIADEVMTGFGRTGRLFASDHLANNPDIICLSKGLTGGTMAMGVTTCTNEIYTAFLSAEKAKTFFHGHSYTANPLACTAALASLDLLEAPDLAERLAVINEEHEAFAFEIRNHERVKGMRILGTILAFDVVTEESDSYFNQAGPKLNKFFLEQGILLRTLGNTVYIMPPYCIRRDQLQLIYKTIRLGLNSLQERN